MNTSDPNGVLAACAKGQQNCHVCPDTACHDNTANNLHVPVKRPKLKPAMTYRELLDALSALAPEQLAQRVRWMGDERGDFIHRLWILEEDYIHDDEYFVAKSEYDAEALASLEDPSDGLPKGTPVLCTDGV